MINTNKQLEQYNRHFLIVFKHCTDLLVERWITSERLVIHDYLPLDSIIDTLTNYMKENYGLQFPFYQISRTTSRFHNLLKMKCKNICLEFNENSHLFVGNYCTNQNSYRKRKIIYIFSLNCGLFLFMFDGIMEKPSIVRVDSAKTLKG